MTRSIPPNQGGSTKDGNGAYLPPQPALPPEQPPSDIDLKDVLDRQLLILWRVTQQLARASATELSKDQIQSLATCIKITMELKAKENELLERLSPEESEALLKKLTGAE